MEWGIIGFTHTLHFYKFLLFLADWNGEGGRPVLRRGVGGMVGQGGTKEEMNRRFPDEWWYLWREWIFKEYGLSVMIFTS